VFCVVLDKKKCRRAFEIDLTFSDVNFFPIKVFFRCNGNSKSFRKSCRLVALSCVALNATCQRLTEFHGISLNSMEFHGISRNSGSTFGRWNLHRKCAESSPRQNPSFLFPANIRARLLGRSAPAIEMSKNRN
jgi:hypothetical protein